MTRRPYLASYGRGICPGRLVAKAARDSRVRVYVNREISQLIRIDGADRLSCLLRVLCRPYAER